jgi:hypothetical protein
MSSSFETTVFQPAGLNATGLPVPDDAVAALGPAKNPAVTVTVRGAASPTGYTYRSTVATRDGRFIVSLSAAHRAAAGLSAGDRVEVTLELDETPRTVTVPEDLAAALAAAGAAALDAFTALSRSKQRAFVDAVESARTTDARERRITKAVASVTGH